MDMAGGRRGCWQGCGGRVGMCFSCKKNEGYSDLVDTVFEHGGRSQKVILSSLRQLFVKELILPEDKMNFYSPLISSFT